MGEMNVEVGNDCGNGYGNKRLDEYENKYETDCGKETGKEAVNGCGSQSGQRMIWMDILRAGAACAVVLMHTMTGAVDITKAAGQENGSRLLLIMDLVTWCVPVFLMISGYLFLNPERKVSAKTMLGKYFLRIVLVLFLFGVPFAWLEQIAAQRCLKAEMLPEGVLMVLTGRSWAHMWYLYLIAGLYLVTPLLKRLLAGMPGPVLKAVMAVLFIGSSVLPFLGKVLQKEGLPVLHENFIYLFYYLYGYLMVTEYSEQRRKREKLLGTAVLVLLMTGSVIGRLVCGVQLQMAYNYPVTVGMAVSLMHLCRGWNPAKCGKVTADIAALSFPIYLIHPLFLNIFYKFLRVTPFDYPPAVSLPVFFLATLVVSVAGAWVLHRSSFLRRLGV